MRERGIRGITRRKRRSLTRPDKKAAVSPDLIGRDFTAAEPGTRLVSDITYLPTLAGWWYLATVIDLATREVIGYAMADHHRAELVVDALKMAAGRGALEEGCITGELIHHSDAGSQYTSFRLAEHLQAAGIAASIGSVGDAYDNALMESTIGLYKTELVKPQRPWKTLSHLELATAEWIDWYNHRRLHGEIGHVPPVEYEANYYTELTKPQVTTTT